MPRKASSVSEIDQILRVHALLYAVGVAPSPRLEVVTAGGTACLGQILRAVVGNTQSAKGWKFLRIDLAGNRTRQGRNRLSRHRVDAKSTSISTGKISAERLPKEASPQQKKGGGWGH